MSMPISKLIAGAGLMCLALAACDEGANKAARTFAPSSSTHEALADCAIGVGAQWTRTCSVERDGSLLTIRHADGGFRRFQILDDQRGLASADGMEPTKISIITDGQIEVSAGEDHYRLPATVSPTAAP